jgi:hypothetical protein
MTALAGLIKRWTTPRTETLVGGAINDVTKTKPKLIAENALLRQQLIVLNRHLLRVQGLYCLI